MRAQVEPPEQLTEQVPVQVTLQVAEFEHDTLPLLPTVMVHSDLSQLTLSPAASVHLPPSLQSALHEPVHEPVQTFPLGQLNEHPPPDGLQPLPVQLQFAPAAQVRPAAQVQVVAVQAQLGPGQTDGGLLPPHAKAREKENDRCRAHQSLLEIS